MRVPGTVLGGCGAGSSLAAGFVSEAALPVAGAAAAVLVSSGSGSVVAGSGVFVERSVMRETRTAGFAVVTGAFVETGRRSV